MEPAQEWLPDLTGDLTGTDRRTSRRALTGRREQPIAGPRGERSPDVASSDHPTSRGAIAGRRAAWLRCARPVPLNPKLLRVVLVAAPLVLVVARPDPGMQTRASASIVTVVQGSPTDVRYPESRS